MVIDGDPLEDLRRSERVAYTMLNGRLYDASTMDQITPDRLERRAFFFEKEGGDILHPATATWLREIAERHRWVH